MQFPIELSPQFLTDEKGERKSVLLSIEDYRSIIEALEDFMDVSALKQAIETETEFRDWDEIEAELKAEGRL